MYYSANQLEAFRHDHDKAQAVLQQLIDAMQAGQPLSIAEEDFVGRWISVARRQEDNERLSLHDYPACQNFLFKRNYLAYLNNFNGDLPVETPLGRIPESEVVKDVAFLEEQRQNWLADMKKGNHSDPLLQYVAAETRNQLKNSAAFASKLHYGEKLKAATEKAVVLHSKYLFYKVKKYFQEKGNPEVKINRDGHKIIIDADSFFHILFRHYAKGVKPYQSEKSYHSDQSIDVENLPEELRAIVNEYFDTVPQGSFNQQRVYVTINGILYALWFKSIEVHRKGQKVRMLRLQTFYPVTQSNEQFYVEKLQPIAAASGRIFYA